MAVSWVYRVNKSKLTNIMAGAKLDTEGTVTDLRQRMVAFIRKWNCHFDGKDLYTFLDHVEELRTGYAFTKTDLLYGIPEILRGNALEWYRNFATDCRDWNAFFNKLRDFYLSSQEKRNLDRQITKRVQGPSESIKEYVNALATLILCRGGIPPSE
ncbi:hypothetical protein TKK_0002884 [Trichogramma kaykai]